MFDHSIAPSGYSLSSSLCFFLINHTRKFKVLQPPSESEFADFVLVKSLKASGLVLLTIFITSVQQVIFCLLSVCLYVCIFGCL